ncbi:MAG: hypothetical protein IPL33_05280 [Sphingobacteriales bacterium]|nr:hypothetical protein [Sphingobacteriales bacterium]
MNCLALIKAISVSWLSSVCLIAQQTASPPTPQLAPQTHYHQGSPNTKKQRCKR